MLIAISLIAGVSCFCALASEPVRQLSACSFRRYSDSEFVWCCMYTSPSGSWLNPCTVQIPTSKCIPLSRVDGDVPAQEMNNRVIH